MTSAISGRTLVAGVVGVAVSHSLSPAIHNAWIAAAGIDAVYVAFVPPADGFARFAEGLRGGTVRGLNITAPFKAQALCLADQVSDRARRAGAANLLIFEKGGPIWADNTDGEGLLAALAEQAPGFDPTAGPTVVLGSGGAARGAASALLEAGAPGVRVVGRSTDGAAAVVALLGDRVECFSQAAAGRALTGANGVINATPAAWNTGGGHILPLAEAPSAAVVMDMVYRPLDTALLKAAAAHGLRTVDGLAMLIGQAAPSFAALFGRRPPDIDVRALALAALKAD